MKSLVGSKEIRKVLQIALAHTWIISAPLDRVKRHQCCCHVSTGNSRDGLDPSVLQAASKMFSFSIVSWNMRDGAGERDVCSGFPRRRPPWAYSGLL